VIDVDAETQMRGLLARFVRHPGNPSVMIENSPNFGIEN